MTCCFVKAVCNLQFTSHSFGLLCCLFTGIVKPPVIWQVVLIPRWGPPQDFVNFMQQPVSYFGSIIHFRYVRAEFPACSKLKGLLQKAIRGAVPLGGSFEKNGSLERY